MTFCYVIGCLAQNPDFYGIIQVRLACSAEETMKFIGINDAYKSNKSNLTSLIATIGICVFCALTGIGVKTMIDLGSESDIKAHESEVAEILEEAVTSETSETAVETSETSESLASASVFESTEATETSVSETTASETTAAETTTLTSEVSETTVKRDAANTDSGSSKSKKKDTAKKKAEPTKAPAATATSTPKPKNSISETKVSLRVYAKGTVNLRSKPDKDSNLVRTLEDGDAIDVVAKTSNGWYKTYNGNYVLASLTTEDKPAAETEATSATKATTTAAKETTKATTKATETTTKATSGESSSAKPDKNGMTLLGSYKVTFYGPQKLKDGTYSRGTASGKTCTEGRTIAADPSIPFGTVIYVENDPLGGDGYYVVEDRGPGVSGNEIDIYAEDGESGNHNTTTRNIYIVNK